MIGVPRKLSVCLFERNLLLGLKMKALKLSKDSSFKGGSFPKLWPDWVWVFLWSRNISETPFEGTEWHQGQFLSLVVCGQNVVAEEIFVSMSGLSSVGTWCPMDGSTARRPALSHPLLPSLCRTPSSTQTHSLFPPYLPASAPDSYLRLMVTQLTALLPCHGDVVTYNVLPL